MEAYQVEDSTVLTIGYCNIAIYAKGTILCRQAHMVRVTSIRTEQSVLNNRSFNVERQLDHCNTYVNLPNIFLFTNVAFKYVFKRYLSYLLGLKMF